MIDWSRMFLGEVDWVRSIANGKFLKEGPINNDLSFPFILGFKSQLILMVQPLEFKNMRNTFRFLGRKGRLFFVKKD